MAIDYVRLAIKIVGAVAFGFLGARILVLRRRSVSPSWVLWRSSTAAAIWYIVFAAGMTVSAIAEVYSPAVLRPVAVGSYVVATLLAVAVERRAKHGSTSIVQQ